MKTTIKFLSFAAILAVAAAPAAYASEVTNSSLTQGPGVYFASTTANSGFDVVTTQNADGSTLQLGLEANLRFVGPITPSGNTYLYTPNAGSLANWDFTFSVNTGTDPLSAYSYLITITDVTNSQSEHFDPTLLPDNGQANGSTVVCNGCTYSGSNDGMQNAENLGFNFLAPGIGFSPSDNDTYKIELSATPKSGDATNVTINVVPTPEPSSLMLFGTGLVAAAGAARRKFKA